jgi:hypothetical protein
LLHPSSPASLPGELSLDLPVMNLFQISSRYKQQALLLKKKKK